MLCYVNVTHSQDSACTLFGKDSDGNIANSVYSLRWICCFNFLYASTGSGSEYNMHVYVFDYIGMYVRMYVCMNVCMYVCVCVYVCYCMYLQFAIKSWLFL